MFPSVRGLYVLRRKKYIPRIKRWSALKKLKWVDVNKIFDVMKVCIFIYLVKYNVGVYTNVTHIYIFLGGM